MLSFGRMARVSGDGVIQASLMEGGVCVCVCVWMWVRVSVWVLVWGVDVDVLGGGGGKGDGTGRGKGGGAEPRRNSRMCVQQALRCARMYAAVFPACPVMLSSLAPCAASIGGRVGACALVCSVEAAVAQLQPRRG
jgi:hypothetical protein